MSTHRSIPRRVTAEQWKPCAGSKAEMPFPPAPSAVVRKTRRVFRKPVWQVKTIHGQWTDIAPFDWIVMEPDGKHAYPVKPNIFAATYEPIED